MSVQTSYNSNSDVAFAGMKADSGFDRVNSGIGEGTIPFGHGLIAGTNTETQVKNADVAGVFRGISVHKHREPSAVGANDAEYAGEEMVSALTQGRIWCAVETSVSGSIAIDDDVFINVDIGGAELGKITDTVGTNIATGGKVVKVDAALELAQIEINLP